MIRTTQAPKRPWYRVGYSTLAHKDTEARLEERNSRLDSPKALERMELRSRARENVSSVENRATTTGAGSTLAEEEVNMDVTSPPNTPSPENLSSSPVSSSVKGASSLSGGSGKGRKWKRGEKAREAGEMMGAGMSKEGVLRSGVLSPRAVQRYRDGDVDGEAFWVELRAKKRAIEMELLNKILEYQGELAGRAASGESTFNIRGGLLTLSQTWRNLQVENRNEVRVGQISINLGEMRKAAEGAGYSEEEIKRLVPGEEGE